LFPTAFIAAFMRRLCAEGGETHRLRPERREGVPLAALAAQSGEGDRLIRPKVITDSGDHDHARAVEVAGEMTMRRSASLA
jgi:hypothetical protein